VKPQTAAAVVKAITEAWPYVETSPDAVVVWADAAPHVEHATAGVAIRRLVRTEERPPSIARFLAECRLIEREKATPYTAIGPGTHTSRAQAAQNISLLRTFWKSAAAGRPEHDHKKGDHLCPACTTSDAWVAEHNPQIIQILREANQ